MSKNVNVKCKTKVVTKKKGTLKNVRNTNISKSFKLFKKRKKSEKIYVGDENNTDEFTENKILSSSYFYKTHMQWNNLPLELNILEDYDNFKLKLEQYLWQSILAVNINDDCRYINSSFELPGD